MINLLDNNEDGNSICPKCNSDNVEIYEYCLEISIKGSKPSSHLQRLHYLCLDCKYSTFQSTSLWGEILPDIISNIKEQFLKWIDYGNPPKKGDKFKIDSFEIEIKRGDND